MADLRLRIDDEGDLSAAHEVARALDVDIREAPVESAEVDDAIAPIAAVLIGAGVLTAAKFIASWWKQQGGGLVIDLREGATDAIHRDRDVPWGFVVVFPADGGKVEIETKAEPEDAAERLIGKVIDGSFKTATAVADAAKEVLTGGDDKVAVKDGE